MAFRYDHDILDDMPPQEFTSTYQNSISEVFPQSKVQIEAEKSATSQALVDFWSFTDPTASLRGDFNKDGHLGIDDLDLLVDEIRLGTNDLLLNLNADGDVDAFDLDIWVHDVKKTFIGDANLDGEFNSGDLVTVFEGGQYEDDIEDNSSWVTGDWNADGDFTSRDLVRAFADGGYEIGPRAAVHAVPEPTTAVLLFSALTLIGFRRN